MEARHQHVSIDQNRLGLSSILREIMITGPETETCHVLTQDSYRRSCLVFVGLEMGLPFSKTFKEASRKAELGQAGTNVSRNTQA